MTSQPVFTPIVEPLMTTLGQTYTQGEINEPKDTKQGKSKRKKRLEKNRS